MIVKKWFYEFENNCVSNSPTNTYKYYDSSMNTYSCVYSYSFNKIEDKDYNICRDNIDYNDFLSWWNNKLYDIIFNWFQLSRIYNSKKDYGIQMYYIDFEETVNEILHMKKNIINWL